MSDILPTHDTLLIWLTCYGSFAIFGLMALGILALPVPEETLMFLAGMLLANEKLPHLPTLIAAYGGAMTGITMSYGIGRLAGFYLLRRFGSKIGLTEERMQQVHDLFEKFGTWTLFIGYFIPGVRHFTGFTAGLTNLSYHEFALFAYSGAFVWVSTFLAAGYFLGEHGLALFELVETYSDEVITTFIVIAAALVGFFLYRKFRA